MDRKHLVSRTARIDHQMASHRTLEYHNLQKLCLKHPKIKDYLPTFLRFPNLFSYRLSTYRYTFDYPWKMIELTWKVYFDQNLLHKDRCKLIVVEALHIHYEPTCANTRYHFKLCECYELAYLFVVFLLVNHRQIQRVHSYHSRHHTNKFIRWNFYKHKDFPSSFGRLYLNSQSIQKNQASSYQQKLKRH